MALEEAQPLRVTGMRGCMLLKWRPIVFLQSPPDSFMCAMCRVVLGIAARYQHFSCGHVLCIRCVDQLLADEVFRCPFDPDGEAKGRLGSCSDEDRETREDVLNALQVRPHPCV